MLKYKCIPVVTTIAWRVVDPDDFLVIAAMGLEPVGSLLVPIEIMLVS